jgi:hypothetical protein
MFPARVAVWLTAKKKDEKRQKKMKNPLDTGRTWRVA